MADHFQKLAGQGCTARSDHDREVLQRPTETLGEDKGGSQRQEP
jgi:hypothetical protein